MLPEAGNNEMVLMSPVPRILAPTAYTIAYFSMEIALDPAIPTYSGGPKCTIDRTFCLKFALPSVKH